MKTVRCLIFLLAVASASAGCASRHWIAPSMEGKVVDARTGAGLAGVEIRRTSVAATAVPVGKTGLDGSFRVDAERIPVRRIPLGDPIHGGNFTFRLDGFKEHRRSFGLFGYDVLREDAPALKNGTIQLEHE